MKSAIVCSGIWLTFHFVSLGSESDLPPDFVLIGTFTKQADVVCTYNTNGRFQLNEKTYRGIDAIKPALQKYPKKNFLVLVIDKTRDTDVVLKQRAKVIAEQLHSIGFKRIVVRRATAGIDACVIWDSTLQPETE